MVKINHVIYFSQLQLLLAKTNENRTISWKALFKGLYRLENIISAVQETGVSWRNGAPLKALLSPSIRCCCDGPRGFRVPSIGPPWCWEKPESRTALCLITVVFSSLDSKVWAIFRIDILNIYLCAACIETGSIGFFTVGLFVVGQFAVKKTK